MDHLFYIVALLLFEFGRLVATVIPRRLCLSAVQVFADLSFFLVYRFRQRSLENLRAVFGAEFDDAALWAIARASSRSFFRAFAEIGLALQQPLEKLRDEIPIKGSEHLEQALAKGKGVIVLSAHLGNFFLLGSRLAAEGYPVRVLIKPTFGARNRRFAELMDGYRLRLGQKTIRARPRRAAARELIQVLRANGLAVLIADEYRSTGLPVPFCGGTVLARRGPVTLAKRTGAAVVPICMVRESGNKLVVVVEPELKFVHTGQLLEDIAENTRRMTHWVERVVRAHPDQWNWAVVRWEEPPKKAPRRSHVGEGMWSGPRGFRHTVKK